MSLLACRRCADLTSISMPPSLNYAAATLGRPGARAQASKPPGPSRAAGRDLTTSPEAQPRNAGGPALPAPAPRAPTRPIEPAMTAPSVPPMPPLCITEQAGEGDPMRAANLNLSRPRRARGAAARTEHPLSRARELDVNRSGSRRGLPARGSPGQGARRTTRRRHASLRGGQPQWQRPPVLRAQRAGAHRATRSAAPGSLMSDSRCLQSLPVEGLKW